MKSSIILQNTFYIPGFDANWLRDWNTDRLYSLSTNSECDLCERCVCVCVCLCIETDLFMWDKRSVTFQEDC